jgi:uncharacterized membrane protein
VIKRNPDLAASSAAALGCALAVVWIPGVHWLRIAFALPLLFVLPGYSLSEALFFRPTIEPLRRLLVSVALSIALAVLIGLILDLTPFGLRVGSWAVALVLATAGESVVASIRRDRASAPGPRVDLLRLKGRDTALLLLAALLVSGGIAFARTPLPATRAQGYTGLWILRSHLIGRVRVGVTSGELHATDYRLVVRQGARKLYERPRLQLAPGQRWADTIRLRGIAPTHQLIEALLYRDDHPHTVYRLVRLWPSASGP